MQSHLVASAKTGYFPLPDIEDQEFFGNQGELAWRVEYRRIPTLLTSRAPVENLTTRKQNQW
jgi:hypothetical protein